MSRYSGGHSSSGARRRKKKKNRTGLIIAAIVILLVIGAAVWLLFFGGLKTLGLNFENKNNTSSGSAVSSTSQSPESVNETPNPTPEPTATPTPEPTAPAIKDDGTDGYMSSELCIYDNKAFELFYGDDEVATSYGQLISSFADKLPAVKVYNMVVPNHSEFGLPERVRNNYGCTSQRENTTAIYNSLSPKVTPVDIYDALNLHNNENIYYNTDTHWSTLGAYYAYTKFCQVSGTQAAALGSFKKTSYPGFTGYLYYATEESCLAENPDTIDIYDPTFSYSAELSYDGLDFSPIDTINTADEAAGYSMLIGGDNGCMRVTNNELSTGRKLMIVKDSYGNAIAPFLTASFDQVHIVDFRYFEPNLESYCTAMGITDVLFFNNTMSANTYSQQETMSNMFN